MKFKKKWLDVPSLSQGNTSDSNDWCGRTSSSMVYNYYKRVAGQDDQMIVNNRSNNGKPRDLIYPDGRIACQHNTSKYHLWKPLKEATDTNWGQPSYAAKEVYPVAGRTSGVDEGVPRDKLLEILNPLLDTLDRNNPVVAFTGLSNSRTCAIHIVVVSGYQNMDDGSLWLLIDDPATMRSSKVAHLGDGNVIVEGTDPELREGSWASIGGRYWLRADELFKSNDHSNSATDLWCDHASRSGFACYYEETLETADSEWSHEVPWGATMRFPVDVGGGLVVTEQSVNGYYQHTEVAHRHGYYPVGENTVWHGGLHLHVRPGTRVCAVADGEVVAARLGETDATSKGAYGSYSFILCRHQASGNVLNKVAGEGKTPFGESDQKPWYSLYVHLGQLELDANSERVKPFTWVDTERVGFRTKVDLNFRQRPSGDVIRTLPAGTEVTLVRPEPETRDGFPWYRIRDVPPGGSRRGTLGYVAWKPEWHDDLFGLDQDFLDKLKTGDVVKVTDGEVKAGDPLWVSGSYGSPGYETGVIHWEVFSEENLVPEWDSVEDDDDDATMDAEEIFKMFPQDRGLDDLFNSNLSGAEIANFYRSNRKARELRTFACKFLSEWALDLDVVVPRLLGVWDVLGLEERWGPYIWWPDAQSAGVDLPSSAKVWHYNPVAFLDAVQKVGGTTETPPPPAPTPPPPPAGQVHDDPPWIEIAEQELQRGVVEIPGDEHNERIVAYHASCSGGENRGDEIHWCSAFVNWCMKEAGQPTTDSAMAIAWKHFWSEGKDLGRPAYGAIAVFWWHQSHETCCSKNCNKADWWENPPAWNTLSCCTIGHVGFVVGKQGSKLVILGGNQGDAVALTAFSKNSIVAYMVPESYEVPANAYDLPEYTADQVSEGTLQGTR